MSGLGLDEWLARIDASGTTNLLTDGPAVTLRQITGDSFASILVLLGRTLRLCRWLRLGERALAAARRLAPQSVMITYDHGWSLIGLGRYDEALAALGFVLARRPDFAAGYYWRGRVLQLLTRHAEAMSAFDQALALDPSDSNIHLDRGISLHNLGRDREALQSYERARRQMPLDLVLEKSIALLKRRMAETADTLDGHRYEMSATIKTTLDRSYELARADRLEDAENLLTHAIEQDGTSWELRVELAGIVGERQRFREALDLAQAVASEHPTNGIVLAVLSACLVHSGLNKEALDTAERLVAMNPTTADARGALGWVLLHSGLQEEALREFQLAVELDSGDMLVLAHKAMTLSALKRHSEAVQAFEQVRASEPSLLSRPDLSSSYEESKKAVEAQRHS